MSADITKCRSGSNYKEGSAVTVQPVIASPSTKIISVNRGNSNKDWSQYITTLSHKWKYPLYYTKGYEILGTTADYATATNADAVVTYAADQYAAHSIEGVVWSYSGGTPAGSTLKIEDGSGTVIFSEDITSEGPGFFMFEEGMKGSVNKSLIITLTAGGSGVVGKVNVVGHKVL